MRNLRKVLGGSPSLLVEYLSMLQDEPTLDSTIREQIRIMVDNLNDYFMEEPRIFKRLEYMAGQTVELLNVSLFNSLTNLIVNYSHKKMECTLKST
jgi:hypothetical protein